MDPIPIYFDYVMRSSISTTPKQPFIDWVKTIDRDHKLPSEAFEAEMYLVKSFETKIQMENWLKKNYDLLFSDQLNNWLTDETFWPQKRNLKMFREWFDYELFTKVSDTVNGFIEKV